MIEKDLIAQFKVSENPSLEDLRIEAFINLNPKNTTKEIEKWFIDKRKNKNMSVKTIPLNQCKSWNFNENYIFHDSNDFFKVEGVRITQSKNREVSNGWDQPILTQVGFDGGIVGLMRKIINGTPHYLVNAKEEPGNYKIVQMSPTIQATFANLNQSHGGKKPQFSDIFLPYLKKKNDNLIFKSWFSEDGGRLLNKRNLGMIVNYSGNKFDTPNDDFIWMTLKQIKGFIKKNAWVNPHLRSLVSYI